MNTRHRTLLSALAPVATLVLGASPAAFKPFGATIPAQLVQQ